MLDVGEDEGEEDEGRIVLVARRTRRMMLRLDMARRPDVVEKSYLYERLSR